MATKRTTKKAPAKRRGSADRMVARARDVIRFPDGGELDQLLVERALTCIRQWVAVEKMTADTPEDAESVESARVNLRRVAEMAVTEELRHLFSAPQGGKAAALTKKRVAAESKSRAVARFKVLTASGERDATEAIGMMTSEGWSRPTLYRHLRCELERLGRGRTVKRASTAKKSAKSK